MNETFIIASSTVGAAVLGVFLPWFIRRVRNPYKWRRMRSKDIPLWVVRRLHERHFPKKVTQSQTEYLIKGGYYEYDVRIKPFPVDEPNARVYHLTVYRRKKK